MKSRGSWAYLLLICAALASAACWGERETPKPPDQAQNWIDDGIPMIEARSTLPTCPACIIELDSMFTIGLPTDTVFPSDGLASIVGGADHRFYVAPLSVEQKIGQYDRHGRLLAMFGGHGEAPGKYYAPAAIAASPDSMLLVLDINQVLWFRLDSLTAEHGPLGDFPNQGGLLAFRGRRFVATSSGGMPGELMYSEPKPDGTQLGVSVSPHTSMTDTEAQLRMWRVITGTDSMWLTMSQKFEAVVEVWQGFQIVRRIRLPAPWYPPYGIEATAASTAGSANGAVWPVTQSIWLDREGVLWTITSVADSTGSVDRRAGGGRSPTEKEILAGAPRPVVSPLRGRFDAVVTAYLISDSTVSLIASARVDPYLVSILSDSVLAERANPEPGLTSFTLYRYALRGYAP